jgi:hypothetical protein
MEPAAVKQMLTAENKSARSAVNDGFATAISLHFHYMKSWVAEIHFRASNLSPTRLNGKEKNISHKS